MEAAWNQERELRSLVKEQQNVIRQMQMAIVDCALLNVHCEEVRDLVDAPCHAAFMVFMAKKQCRGWWVRKSEALLGSVDIGEETPRREMVSQLWRKFHDVVSTLRISLVSVLSPVCLAAWDVVHGPPTASTLEVSLSFFWTNGVHGTCPLPHLLAPCSLGDVALDFVHGCNVLQGSHGLAFRKISESLRGDSFSTWLLSFLEGRNGHLLRAFSLALFPILPPRKMTLCHCLSRLGTVMGTVCFFGHLFWGCNPVVGTGTAILHLGSGCRDSSFGDLALAGPALLLLALPPFFGWVSLGPKRVCVWGCVRGCVWVRVLAGLRCWLESRFLHVSMPFVKEPRNDIRLYVRSVFIMDDCDELIPGLNFVKSTS